MSTIGNTPENVFQPNDISKTDPSFEGTISDKTVKLTKQDGTTISVKYHHQEKVSSGSPKPHYVQLPVYDPKTGQKLTVFVHQTQFIGRKELSTGGMPLGLDGKDQSRAINQLSKTLKIATPDELSSKDSSRGSSVQSVTSSTDETRFDPLAALEQAISEVSNQRLSFSLSGSPISSESSSLSGQIQPVSSDESLDAAIALLSNLEGNSDDLSAILSGFADIESTKNEEFEILPEHLERAEKFVKENRDNWNEAVDIHEFESGLPFVIMHIPNKGTFLHLSSATIEGGNAKIISLYDIDKGTTHAIRVLQKETALTEHEKTMHTKLQENPLFVAGHTVRWNSGETPQEGVLMPKMKRDLLAEMRMRPLSEGDIQKFARRSAQALEHLHEQVGYLHLDFHPRNLMLDNDQNLRLGDFGNACPKDTVQLTPGRTTGTPGYLAPEMTQRMAGANYPITVKSDIWQWGVTMLQLSSKELRESTDFDPFHQNGEIHEALAYTTQEKIDEVVNKYLPPESERTAVQALIARCLQEDPSKRPTAKELLEVLAN